MEMINPDEYPVYNHYTRPAIGRNHLGELFFNCFSVSLNKDKVGDFIPFTFNDFLKQYNEYSKHIKTCEHCIEKNEIYTFPFNGSNVDRSAVEKKFNNSKVNESNFFYCPLIREVLLNSFLDFLRYFESMEILYHTRVLFYMLDQSLLKAF